MMRTAAVIVGVVAGVASVSPSATAAPPQTRFVISGSKTLLPVVEQWTKEFSAIHPELVFVVEGGGTDKGFEALLAGTSTVAMAARRIGEPEQKAAASRGLTIEEYVVAQSGICVLKSKKNPIAVLDVDKLRRVFDGSADRWSAVGGPEEPITVILRNPSSHTSEFFRSAVLAPGVLTDRGIVVGTQEEVVAEITKNPWAVGFADFDRATGSLDQVEVLRVRIMDGPGELVFKRPLFFYVCGPTPSAIKDLVAFVRGPRGLEIAALHSYLGAE